MEQVVICGGGFGGLYTAKQLLSHDTDVHVTVVSDCNYFLFVPMLHEVATGNIQPRNIIHSLRELLQDERASFTQSRVESIDLEEQVVETSGEDINYDYVVAALGSTVNFFDTPGAEEHCYTLKSLSDAFTLRNDVIRSFEQASESDVPADELRTVIVGGGPTGVELACELAEWAEELERLYDLHDAFDLHLVDLNEKVLHGVDEKLRDHAMHVLEQNDITVHTETAAEEVNTDTCVLDDGTELEVSMTVWAAGVTPVDIPFTGVTKVKGAVPVDQDLTVEGYDNAFALGDLAGFSNPDGTRFPPTAQLAYQQAFGAGDNVARAVRGEETEPFTFKEKGFLASLGKGEAVADIHGLRLYGFLAWFLWRTVYLAKLVGMQNTLRVMMDWTFDLFTGRDTSMIPT